jgi:site-specific recombinase XerD
MIDAKISFLNQIEMRLSTEVTADAMSRMMKITSDVLEGFDMREIMRNDDGIDDLLSGFLNALRVEGRSQKTIDRYSYEIGRLMQFVGVPTRKITVYHIRDYLANEKARGICDNTLKGKREIYSSYFNWLQRESLIDRNPIVNIGPIKVPKKKKELYTEVDMEKLKRNCKNSRDLAVVLFLYSTCCRIGEVIELNRDQVIIENQKLIVHGKGDKERKVYFDSVTADALKQYMDERTDDCEALFISSRQKKRFTAGGIRAMLKRVAAAAGVNHVHPHKFRRTKATEMARHGMPIQDVQAILGHEKIDTTMQYVQMNDTDIESSYRRFA